MKHLNLAGISDESALTRQDLSLVRALFVSQLNRIEYLDLSRNPNLVKDPHCAQMLI